MTLVEQWLFPEFEHHIDVPDETFSYEGLTKVEEPKTDNDTLLNYQYEYLTTGSSKAWAGMWTVARVVVQRMITAERKKKGFFLNPDQVEDAVSNAVEYVMRRYHTNEGKRTGYFVKQKFLPQFYGAVQHALYYQKGVDKILSYVDSDTLTLLGGKQIF